MRTRTARIWVMALALVLAGAAPAGAGYFYDAYWQPVAMPEGSSPPWTRAMDDAVRTLVQGDYLRLDTTNAAADREQYVIRDDPSVINTGVPFTADFRLKVNETSHGTVATCFLALWHDGSPPGYQYVRYEFDETGVRPRANEGAKVALDTTVWHDYRLSVSGNAGGSRTAKLYVLDPTPQLLLSTGAQGSGSLTWSDTLYWGDVFTSDSGSADWAFIGWTSEGAFGPDDVLNVPEPCSMAILGLGATALAWRRRTRRA